MQVGWEVIFTIIYLVRTCLMEMFDLVISFSLPLVDTHISQNEGFNPALFGRHGSR